MTVKKAYYIRVFCAIAIFLVALLVFSLVSSAGTSSSANAVIKTKTTLYKTTVKSKGNYGSISKGEKITAIKVSGAFYYIQYGSKKGYVPKTAVTMIPKDQVIKKETIYYAKPISILDVPLSAGEKIALVNQYVPLEISAKNGNYYKIVIQGRTGYVPVSGVNRMGDEQPASAKADVKTASTAVYNVPDKNAKQIANVTRNAQLNVVAVSKSFYKVAIDDKNGYVPKTDVILETNASGTVPASSASAETSGNTAASSNVKPQTPTGLTVSRQGNSFSISWNAVSEATSYRVYSAASSTGPWKTKIYEGSAASVVVRDDPKPKYCVVVVAVRNNLESLPCNAVEVLTTPAPPKMYESEYSKANAGYTRLRMQTDPDSYLYMSETPDGEYTKLMESQYSSDVEVLGLQSGKTYYFKQMHHCYGLSIKSDLSAPAAVKTLAMDPTLPASWNSNEKEIFQLMNLERTMRGMAPLKTDPALVKIAQEKCVDMAKKNYFDHTEPSGYFNWRFAEIGYKAACGENIYYASVGLNPMRANEKFMESEGHRKNVLNPSYKSVGVGVIETESTQSGIRSTYRFVAQEFYVY